MHGSPARTLIALVVIGLTYLGWAGYLSRSNELERIKQQGELIVATRKGPGTYVLGPNGPEGLEYDLIRRFARSLGVEPRFMFASNESELFQMLASRQVHLVAAGVVATEDLKARFRFTQPYMTVHTQVVYRAGSRRPRQASDIEPGKLAVLKGSNYVTVLRNLQGEYDNLSWIETDEYSIEELLYRVWSSQIPYTVARSNELILNQQFYPELRAAFDLSTDEGLAWALPQTHDTSLYDAVQEFFERIREDGTLAHLMEKYYGHLNRFDYVGTRTFMQDITQKLPKYRPLFEQAAEETGLDWRLLAAIGYQESHWDPDAVSPTGVRGIMMLTLNTARSLGVKNRRDPTESIFGGARYFARVLEMIPERIEEPVRTWLALAAYNVGFGHLQDARMLAEQRGYDPNSWVHVKEHLPLLSERKWYKKTRYGYARGLEPVRYVENVRTYYELLSRITEPEEPQDNESVVNPVRTLSRGVRMSAPLESAY